MPMPMPMLNYVLTVTRLIAGDGTELAVHDFGGKGATLLLVHATGFHAHVLAPMARELIGAFHCLGLDQRAHGDSGRPATGNLGWQAFGQDVLDVVDRLGFPHPLFGFGHSMGATSLLLAEESAPGAFDAIYCFEPVMLPQIGPLAPQHTNPLSAGALRRREEFPSAEDARANFASKAPFDRFDPRVLDAYVEHGFAPTPEGTVRLKCRRSDEATIYAHGFAHDAFAGLGRVLCPVALACGGDTDSFGPDLLALDAARLSQATVTVLSGLGHFGPMEAPAAVAASVRAQLTGNARSV